MEEGLFNKHLTNLNSMPFSLFWKDIQLNYLGGNQFFKNLAGLNENEQIIGKNDYDLPWAQTDAMIYRKVDHKVINEGKRINNIKETLLDCGGATLFQIVSKIPLLNKKNKIIGVCGIAQPYHRAPKINFEENLFEELKNRFSIYKLNRHELKCICLWVAEYSIRDISNILKVSPKFIKKIMGSIKTKLNINNEAQIIELLHFYGIYYLYLRAAGFIIESHKNSKSIPHLSDNLKLKISVREMDCLKHILEGRTAKSTAKILGLSHRTVEQYLNNIKNKIGVKYKNELIEKAKLFDWYSFD